MGFLRLQSQANCCLRCVTSLADMHPRSGFGCEPLSEVWLLCRFLGPPRPPHLPVPTQRLVPCRGLPAVPQLNARWQPEHSPPPGSEPRPEASAGLLTRPEPTAAEAGGASCCSTQAEAAGREGVWARSRPSASCGQLCTTKVRHRWPVAGVAAWEGRRGWHRSLPDQKAALPAGPGAPCSPCGPAAPLSPETQASCVHPSRRISASLHGPLACLSSPMSPTRLDLPGREELCLVHVCIPHGSNPVL